MKNEANAGFYRKNIQIGMAVEVVQKKDQRSGQLTEGVVKRILTKSPRHTRGIKVMLESGEVGRVQHILDDDFNEDDKEVNKKN